MILPVCTNYLFVAELIVVKGNCGSCTQKEFNTCHDFFWCNYIFKSFNVKIKFP